MAILAQRFKFCWLMLRKVYKNSYKIDKVLVIGSCVSRREKDRHPGGRTLYCIDFCMEGRGFQSRTLCKENYGLAIIWNGESNASISTLCHVPCSVLLSSSW